LLSYTYVRFVNVLLCVIFVDFFASEGRSEAAPVRRSASTDKAVSPLDTSLPVAGSSPTQILPVRHSSHKSSVRPSQPTVSPVLSTTKNNTDSSKCG